MSSRSSINVINTSKPKDKNQSTNDQCCSSSLMENGGSIANKDGDELRIKKSVLREIGSQAVWSLSSCKPGFGVEQLRDNCPQTYWQSDGSQPHLVNIQFRRKTTVSQIGIYADFKMDESYTPNKISIRAGNHFHDIHEVAFVTMNEPSGWDFIDLKDANDRPIRAFLIQIAVLGNHQNGRDTHIRQIKVLSPVEDTVVSVLKLPDDFSSIKFWRHACLR